jgi:hypothetical protein
MTEEIAAKIRQQTTATPQDDNTQDALAEAFGEKFLAQKRQTVAEQASAYISTNVSLSASGDDLIETLQKLISQLAALQTNMPVNPAVEESLRLQNVAYGLRPLVREMVGEIDAAHSYETAGIKVNQAMHSVSMMILNKKLLAMEAIDPEAILNRYGLQDKWDDRPHHNPVNLAQQPTDTKIELHTTKAPTPKQEKTREERHEELAKNAKAIAAQFGITHTWGY